MKNKTKQKTEERKTTYLVLVEFLLLVQSLVNHSTRQSITQPIHPWMNHRCTGTYRGCMDVYACGRETQGGGIVNGSVLHSTARVLKGKEDEESALLSSESKKSHCLTSMVQDSCGSTTILNIFHRNVHLPLYYIVHLSVHLPLYYYTIYSTSVYI